MQYSHLGLKELLPGKQTSHANMSPVYVSLTSGQVSLVFPLINISPSMPRATLKIFQTDISITQGLSRTIHDLHENKPIIIVIIPIPLSNLLYSTENRKAVYYQSCLSVRSQPSCQVKIQVVGPQCIALAYAMNIKYICAKYQ